MKFTKMEGLGNDYIYVNCFEENISEPVRAAIALSDRHFGIGSDGLILIKPSDKADFTMDMYNADGSRSEMCGNGIRCVGKYVYDYGLTRKTAISIETLAGIKYLDLSVTDGKVDMVTVDMGAPIFKAAEIPVISENDSVIDEPISIDGVQYRMTCVSMGNPHAVVFAEDVEKFPVEQIGPLFEQNERFPERVNVEFIQIIDKNTIKMRVWERGSGETMACGTGSCAATAACVRNHKTDNNITVKLLGGDLFVRYDRENDKIYMTGPAKVVFDGVTDRF